MGPSRKAALILLTCAGLAAAAARASTPASDHTTADSAAAAAAASAPTGQDVRAAGDVRAEQQRPSPPPATSATEGADVGYEPERAAKVARRFPDMWTTPGRFDADVRLPPAWAFGVLHGYYTGQAGLLANVEKLLAGDFPADAVWVDSSFWDVTTKGPRGYINFRGDPQAFPDVKALCDTLHKRGLRFGVWMWDRLLDAQQPEFDDFDRRGFFKGDPIVGNGWHNEGKVAVGRFVNFEDPAAAAYWKERMQPLMDAGLDFFKLDSGPQTAFVRTHFELTQAATRSKGRGFVLSHAGRQSPEAIKRYPTAWTGDSLPAWRHDAFPDPVQWVWGGFRNMPGTGQGTPELYMRWVQFSAFGAVMEVFGSMFFPAQNAPFTWPEEAQRNFRRYTQLRLRLFPYIYSHAHLVRQESRKIVEGVPGRPDQFFFGRELMAAPVYDGGATTRRAWLPEGDDWIDFWTGERHTGGRLVTLAAPLDRLPLLVRAGAIIPMREYARAVSLGSNAKLSLDIYPPRTPSTFTLYEDDGLSEAYLDGGFATTRITSSREEGGVRVEIAPMEGDHYGRVAERRWTLRVHLGRQPRTVRVNAEDTPWDFDPARGGIVIVQFTSATDRGNVVTVH
jgi:alpha-glucosidase (family GH31 glycosyl hydrolase)